MRYCKCAGNIVLSSIAVLLPSRVHITAIANLWSFFDLPTVSTFQVVDRFLPYSKIIFLHYLLPAEALCQVLNFILLLLQVFFCPLPPFGVPLPVDWRPRKDPVAPWSKNSVYFNQIYTICQEQP
jgi:hypothetical protein